MAILNFKSCDFFIDKEFRKTSKLHVKDKDGNVFIPWHHWKNKAIIYLKFEDEDVFTYWSNKSAATTNFQIFGTKVTELPIELPRLLCKKVITIEEYNNIINMLKSEDIENFRVVYTIMCQYRKVRLKSCKQQKNKR